MMLSQDCIVDRLVVEKTTPEHCFDLAPRLKSIDRYELANINSLNFYIHDILQDGVSSNNRKDGQAKSLGEYLRAKKIKVPKNLLEDQ